MDKWWLQEPYVSRILDEVEIQKSNGEIKFTLTKCRNNESDPIAVVANAHEVLGEDLLHCLCGPFLNICAAEEGYDWNGEWNGIPDGTYLIDLDQSDCLIEIDQSVFDGHYFREIRLTDSGAIPESTALVGFPRFWELFGFILPRQTRELVFTPAYHDLLADHLLAQQHRFQSRHARWWIRFCFTLRSGCLAFECLAVALKRKGWVLILFLVPPGIREQVWAWFRVFR
jgi:hypothetical protein